MMRAPTHPSASASLQRLATTTGMLYLVIAVFGMFAPMVLDSVLVGGDAAATAANVLDSLGLFRLSLVAWIFIVAADVAVSVTLFLLFDRVSLTVSAISSAFRLTYTAILGALLINAFDAYALLTSTERVSTGSEAAALAALETFNGGFQVALAFFGVHITMFGYLLYRSGYAPRALAIVLALAGPGYVVNTFAFFFVDNWGDTASIIALTPALIGELGLTAWLLLKDIRVERAAGTERRSSISLAAADVAGGQR